MSDAANKPWPLGLDPTAVTTTQEFGDQLELLRRAMPAPADYNKLARVAFPGQSLADKSPKYGAVRNWFLGKNLPRDFAPVRLLLIWLTRQAGLANAAGLVAAFETAHEGLASKRSAEQRERAEEARQGGKAPVFQDTQDEASEPALVPGVSAGPEPWWRGRKVLAVMAICVVLGVIAGVGLTSWLGSPPSLLSFATCAEGIKANPSVAFAVVVQEVGPSGVPQPNRRIEMRTQPTSAGEWIVWAHLEPSVSELDRLWLDWSYDNRPDDPSRWRQCGPQPITASAQTPGVLARDSDGHRRWFRACGQVPEKEWLPGRTGSFCTSWSRPPDV